MCAVGQEGTCRQRDTVEWKNRQTQASKDKVSFPFAFVV